jgi:hypothetical protein
MQLNNIIRYEIKKEKNKKDVDTYQKVLYHKGASKRCTTKPNDIKERKQYERKNLLQRRRHC